MAFAERTDVTVAKTKMEIDTLLVKRKATAVSFYADTDKAIVMFRMDDRLIRFTLPLPALSQRGSDQAQRSKWRALLLVIKAKLESVDSKIETLEEAFLAHVVMSDGATIYERAKAPIAEEYRLGRVQQFLLTGPSS